MANKTAFIWHNPGGPLPSRNSAGYYHPSGPMIPWGRTFHEVPITVKGNADQAHLRQHGYGQNSDVPTNPGLVPPSTNPGYRPPSSFPTPGGWAPTNLPSPPINLPNQPVPTNTFPPAPTNLPLQWY